MARLGAPVTNWQPAARDFAPLSGRYARLDPLTPGHAGQLHAANSRNDAIWDYMSYGPFADAQNYAEWIAGITADPDCFFYAITDRETGRVCGVASYLRINPKAGSVEVGHIAYAPDLQKTRAGSEAMFLMMRQAFALGYRRYEWKCNALNLGSRRAAQRYGFSFEGVHRQADVVKGRNRDTAWFSILDSEWDGVRAAFETWLAPENFDAGGGQRQSLSSLTRAQLQMRDPAL